MYRLFVCLCQVLQIVLEAVSKGHQLSSWRQVGPELWQAYPRAGSPDWAFTLIRNLVHEGSFPDSWEGVDVSQRNPAAEPQTTRVTSGGLPELSWKKLL